MVYRRRGYKKRAYKKRGMKKRSYVRKSGFGRTGGFRLVRKLPDMAISSSSTGGLVSVTDPTGTCVGVGIAALSAGSSTGWDVPFSLTFRLAQLINSSDITGIADKYKITGAYVRLFYNKSNAQAGASAGMPYIEYISDHDDASVPTFTSLREKMGVKLSTFKNGSSYIGMKCRPKPAREIFNNGITTAYEQPKGAIWIDCSNPNVEHYGIKGMIHNMWLPAIGGQEVIKVDVSLTVVAKDLQ